MENIQSSIIREYYEKLDDFFGGQRYTQHLPIHLNFEHLNKFLTKGHRKIVLDYTRIYSRANLERLKNEVINKTFENHTFTSSEYYEYIVKYLTFKIIWAYTIIENDERYALNQHWISRCYLKDFSSGIGKKNILSFTKRDGSQPVKMNEDIFIHFPKNRKTHYPKNIEIFFSGIESDYGHNKEIFATNREDWRKIIIAAFFIMQQVRKPSNLSLAGNKKLNKQWEDLTYGKHTILESLFSHAEKMKNHMNISIYTAKTPLLCAPTIPASEKRFGNSSSYILPIDRKNAIIFSNCIISHQTGERLMRSYNYSLRKRVRSHQASFYM